MHHFFFWPLELWYLLVRKYKLWIELVFRKLCFEKNEEAEDLMRKIEKAEEWARYDVSCSQQ